jgi:hypothetical protein
MMNRLRPSIALSTIMAALTATWAGAQTPAQSHFLDRGTELGGSFAAAATSSETAPMLSGTAGWGINPWFTIEGRGAWFARGEHTNGLGADVGALVNVVRKRHTTPYVAVAFGLYRQTIDTDMADVSDFYRHRMHQSVGGLSVRTFTDPAWRFGAGVDMIRHRTISIRPEAGVTLVHRNGATDTITTFGVRLGWIFEDHPVTPSVR